MRPTIIGEMAEGGWLLTNLRGQRGIDEALAELASVVQGEARPLHAMLAEELHTIARYGQPVSGEFRNTPNEEDFLVNAGVFTALPTLADADRALARRLRTEIAAQARRGLVSFK